MISEDYKKKILNLSGILLENNLKKLTDFGISDSIANYITNIDEKLSIFLINITLAEFAKSEGLEGGNLREIIPIINQSEYLNFLEKNVGRINYVVEWIKSPNREEVNLKDIKNLTQAFEMADLWHNSSEASGNISDESGDIVKTYPKEGYYWIDLKTNCSTQEKEAMGHCGKDTLATTLFSLRDKNKSPHATIAYDERNKSLRQVKGRANKRPLPEYMKYVYDFLRWMVDKDQIKNVKWSYGEDLTKDEINFIFEGRKDVLINSFLENNLKQLTYFQVPFTKEEIINTIGEKEYKEYLKNLINRSIELSTFNPKLKKNDIVFAIGEDGYESYVKEIFNKSLIDKRYQIGLPKNDIIRIIGEDQYNKYIHNVLDDVLRDPTRNTINLTKDELFAMLGELGYKNYIKELLSKILENNYVNSDSALSYVLRKHGIQMDKDKIKSIVSPKVWFQFIKKSLMKANSNIGAGIW